MEKWLKDQLVAQGKITPRGVGRRASVRPCPRCGAWTFQGLDADVCAGEAMTDLGPLDPFGELVARTAGIETYNLRWLGDRYELDFRDHYEIEGNPPGTRPNVDVVAGHRCGIDIAHRSPSRLPPRRRAITGGNDGPPF